MIHRSSPWSCRSLNFFFVAVWSSVSVSRRSVREHAGRQSGIAWRGCGGGYDHEASAERSQRKSGMAAHRRAAPFPGPAAPGMAGHVPLSESSRREAEGPLSPAPWGRAGFAKGRCPLASAHSRMSNTGFPVRRAFCCFLAGFVVCRRSGRQTCRVGLVLVRGQFRFGHWSPWMAAATMAARLHSSSIASARIAASMARSSPTHHSM